MNRRDRWDSVPLYYACLAGALQPEALLIADPSPVEPLAGMLASHAPHALRCAGQSDVAHYLLEAGAVCNEFTFDGDRCHYAALTSTIRCGQRPPTLRLSLAEACKQMPD